MSAVWASFAESSEYSRIALILGGEVITVSDWLSDSSLSQSARKNRKFILGRYANANGKEVPSKKATNDQAARATEKIEEIKSGKLRSTPQQDVSWTS